MAYLRSAVTRGILAGLIAGIPQVVVTQIETQVFDLPREQADIGPRFVQRLAQHLGTSVSPPLKWLLATGFHFEYAAQWGALYALLQEWRRMPPLVGAPMLAALIYALAFSPWGAATQTRAERPAHRRRTRETLLHWSAALAYSLSMAYTYEWLRSRQTAPVQDAADVVTRPLQAAS